MSTSESQNNHNQVADLAVTQDVFQHARYDFDELTSVSFSNAHQAPSSWDGNQNLQVEECIIPLSHTDPLIEGELEEVLMDSVVTTGDNHSNSRSGDVDAVPIPPHPQSPLSVTGDSNGSPSIGSPISLSPDSQGSPDSMGPSDCENHPVSPCHSPYYSRPGSPWPMFARPSFKKARSPFWTTFRVKEFR